ncbi:MAG: hypothetical protein CMB99_01500 [Flavobacteriaceae bacterium]|nr:hypothetical protein [Flavobacteriaceae bacterium]
MLKRAGYNDAGSGSSYRRATGRTWVDPTGDHRYVVQENGQSVRRESHYKRDGKMGWYGSGQGAAIEVLTKWSKLGGTHVGDKTAEKKAKKREGALGYEDSVHAAVETMHTHLKSGLDKLLPADVVASRRESGKKFGGASFSRSGELLVKVAQASGYKESTVGKTTWYESPDGSHRFTAKRWADDTLVSVKKPNGKWGKKTKVNTWGHADPFVTIMNNHLFAPAAEPPKPKPEVKPPKPKKSLTTGTRPKGRGAAQNAVIAHMAAMGPHARFTLTDMARAPAFRRMDFGKIQSAVGALAKRGVVYEDATGGLSWGEAWFAKPKAGGAVAPKPPKPPKPPPPPKPKTRHSTVGKSRDMNEHGHRYELKPGDTLKARAKHGGGEVKVLADGKYEYDGKTYKSTNALLNVLHKIGTEGAPKRHGTTFGRYFGLVKQQRPGKVAKALGELRTLLKSHGVLVTIEDDGNEIGLMGDLAKAGVPAHMLPHAGAGYTSMDDEVAEDLISHLRGSA